MNPISISIAASMALALPSPWDVTLPVDGLTRDNAPEFERRVMSHFAIIRNSDGERYRLSVQTADDLATFRLHDRALRLADVQAALKGSPFALRPQSWYAFGCVALEWETKHPLSPKQIQRLESALGGFGSVGKRADGTRFAEVVRVDPRERLVYHAHIRFKKDGRGPAHKVAEIVRACGIDIVRSTLLWERDPHMPWNDLACGARRKSRPSAERRNLRRPAPCSALSTEHEVGTDAHRWGRTR